MAIGRIIVHGGSGDWSDNLDGPKRDSLEKAALLGHEVLAMGNSALDAVVRAVKWLEDDPLFDAGTGSHLNEDGMVEMDAIIINGATLDFGAVAGVQRVRYPIELARKVMEDTPHNFFVGTGADALAAKLGIPLVTNLSLVSDFELTKFREKLANASMSKSAMGTVGAVALDTEGNIAVATSTGGTPHKRAGRVGDSPLFGAGGYANNQFGGASSTGHGEHSMRALLAKYIVDQIAGSKDAQAAADAAMAYVDTLFDDSQLAAIVLDKDGNFGAAHTTNKLSIAWMAEDDETPQSSIKGGLS